MNIDWNSIAGLIKIARISQIPKAAVFSRMKEVADRRKGLDEDPEDADTRLHGIIEEVYAIPVAELSAVKEWFLREAQKLDPESDDEDEEAETLLNELGRRGAN